MTSVLSAKSAQTKSHALVSTRHVEKFRIKRVALTKKGVKTKEALAAQLYDSPEELVALEREDLERLLSAAGKLSTRRS